MIFRILTALPAVMALSAVLAAGGTYVLYAIKDRGALQQSLEQVRQALKTERSHAADWQAHAEDIRRLAARFDEYEIELRQARQDREKLAREVDARISDIRIEFPEAQDFLASRAPVQLVRVLCGATIDPDSPDCKALDTE